MKKTLTFVILFAVLVAGVQVWAGSLSITGVVRQPLNLSMEDLERYQSIQIQLNELLKDGGFRGMFYYRGIPLKTLLEAACIQKEETAFHKPVDLAILVRNREGSQVALSWGEVFYKNPGRIVVATSAVAIMPRRDCKDCHGPEVYEPRLAPLHRKIGFPKLVVTGDRFADRCLEEITSIEVMDLRPKMDAEKMDPLFSPKLQITGEVKNPLSITDISGYPRVEVLYHHVGDGKGYHGSMRLQGTLLKPILEKAGVEPALDSVLIVSAPDGYRSLFSYGEIFLDPDAERMMIADRMDGEPLAKGGKFKLILPDDLMSERCLMALEKVEVIPLGKNPKLYVIGIGCGDTSLITLEAISYMARADVYVCPPDIQKRFGKYMGDKPVLFNIYDFAPPVLRKKHSDLPKEELDKLMEEKRTNAANIIRDYLNKNRTVAILDYGDPTIWSGSRWVTGLFSEEMLEIIPGLSSFNVSNAMLKRDTGCNGSIVLSTGHGIKDNPAMIKPLAENGDTLAVFMGLKDIGELVSIFKEHYPGNTPASLAYKAGYSGNEHLIETTLDGLISEAEGYHEKFLGLIYLGPCIGLEGSKDCK
jgi:precorrin-4 methylase/DMSO/TMAO reductase YedYZ molybdopterin-dependent catalytic subunit